MSINELATKQQISRLVNYALFAIRNRSQDPNWLKVVNNSSEQLSLISRNLRAAMQSTQHFGRVMATGTHGAAAYRTAQSTNSKLGTLSSLEDFLLKQWEQIVKAVGDEMRKLPTEDKNSVELLDMFSGELENFDNLLKQHGNKVTQHLSHHPSFSQAQRELGQLKSLPDFSATSMLVLLALGIRIVAIAVGGISTKKK